MKGIVLSIIALLAVNVIAQNKQIIYGVEEIPQSLMLNPGINAPQKKHFGLPFLSQFHLNAGSSGVSVYDIFGKSNVDINTRIRNKIFDMKNTDFFTVTQQLDLFNFGWRSAKDIYFSGGIYQEFDFILYFPRDLAILGWEGNHDYIDYEFDLGEVSTTGDLLAVYHFGANKRISKKVTAGVRMKLYSSMASFRSTRNQGTFVTRIGDGSTNIYEHILENAEMTLETSGYRSLTGMEDPGVITKKILGRTFLGGNIGLGMDIGATYEINDSWTASASMLDLGAIFHLKDVETYQASGDYTLDGIELLFPPLSAGEPSYPYYDDLLDEIEREVPIDTLHNSYTQMRPLKINAGVTHKFGRWIGKEECDCQDRGGDLTNQSVGLQIYSVFRPKAPQTAATLFYYRRWTEYLSMKATYTADSFSFSNIGLGMVADIGKFNFYIAADNLFRYGNITKAKSVSLQIGFNIKIDEK